MSYMFKKINVANTSYATQGQFWGMTVFFWKTKVELLMLRQSGKVSMLKFQQLKLAFSVVNC